MRDTLSRVALRTKLKSTLKITTGYILLRISKMKRLVKRRKDFLCCTNGGSVFLECPVLLSFLKFNCVLSTRSSQISLFLLFKIIYQSSSASLSWSPSSSPCSEDAMGLIMACLSLPLFTNEDCDDTGASISVFRW